MSSHDGPCKHCGHCPHCGQPIPAVVMPYQPLNPWPNPQPWYVSPAPIPLMPTTIWSGTTTAIRVGEGFQ